MPEAQGPSIAEWQSQQQYYESQSKKKGFGLGYGDSVSTILDGIKWLLHFHEGAISAYCNIFESLINGSCITTLLGKSDNMFGIKLLEDLAEHFSYNMNKENALFDEVNVDSVDRKEYNPTDYPYVNQEIALDAEGLRGIHNNDMSNYDYFSRSFSEHQLLQAIENTYYHEF